MNTSGDRLRALLRECHLSATDFAANRKVTPQHVNNWFKRGIPMARLDEVAELLTVNARWLRTGEGPKHPCDSANENNGGDSGASRHTSRSSLRSDVEVPVYKETESDTGDVLIAEAPGKKVRLPLHVLQSMNINIDNAICVAMIGNSMADKIQDGSVIGIDPRPDPHHRRRNVCPRTRRHAPREIPLPPTRQRPAPAQPQQQRTS